MIRYSPAAIVIFILVFTYPIYCFSQSESVQLISPEGMTAVMYDQEGNEYTLEDVLSTARGKRIFIDIWASWCRDCIPGFPTIGKYIDKYGSEEIEYVFLSVDENVGKWKNALKKFNLAGKHYRLEGGWDNPFCKVINLDWIPRYMVLDETGAVIHYKSVDAKDPDLKALLKASIKK